MLLLELSLTRTLGSYLGCTVQYTAHPLETSSATSTPGQGTHRKASKHANAFGHINEGQLLRCGHDDSR